jgi:DNA-binding response OmpR family regulator
VRVAVAGDVPTVLVVEDEPDVVEIYALALDGDYEVRKAYTGEEALEKADESVDVVVLDRHMPGPSGREVLAEIRQRGLDAHVAVVTAVDPDFDVAGMAFDEYLTKPVDSEDVREVVEELLERSAHEARRGKLASILERIATLEAEKTERELAASDEYAALQERAAELRTQGDGPTDGTDATDGTDRADRTNADPSKSGADDASGG